MAFTLHPQLEADTLDVLPLPLSRVRLMNDKTWPWVIVVPQRAETTEVFELDDHERRLFIDEIALAATVLRDLFQPHKINVAALGNQVRQLHCHVIARFHHDPAWPRPIWGTRPPAAYDPHDAATLVAALQDAFARNLPAFDALLPRALPGPAGEPASNLWSMFGFTDR